LKHAVTLIQGDGIGPEVLEAARRVIDASGVDVEWEVMNAGATALETTGSLLPDRVIESIKRNKVALKGPITTPVGTGFRSVNVALRKALDLYACFRPCHTIEGIPSRYENVDIVVVRENTEDLYAGIEFEKGSSEAEELIASFSHMKDQAFRKDSGISVKLISETGTRRIASSAFEYAKRNNRTKVTAVHKANIMKYSDGLFLRVAREVAGEYPNIQFDDVIIDALCTQLVQQPEQFDVLLLPNLYGDVVSDLCAGLIGGLGVAPGANVGDEYAVFEAVHGSAPDIAGKNKANPTAMILSGTMMLRHIGEGDAAERIEAALLKVLAEGNVVTGDLRSGADRGRGVGTREMVDAIVAGL
jgi:isocitrate dehydrogenase (NAD+)